MSSVQQIHLPGTAQGYDPFAKLKPSPQNNINSRLGRYVHVEFAGIR